MVLRNGSPEEAGMNPAKVEQAEDLVRELVNSGGTHAFVLLASRKGITVSHKAFGTLSHEKNSPPLTTDVLFPISSLTKPITATAVMMLFEEGKLDINKPVVQYVPEFIGEGKEEVLVWQLMTHSTGMNDDAIQNWWKENQNNINIPPPAENQNAWIHEYLYPGLLAPLWKKPSVEMSYCSWGVELLGDIIRRVNGQSYESFVRERIFEPLGMKDSFVIVPQSESYRIVRRPEELGGTWFMSKEALETPRACTGLYSTAYDLAIFGQMFLNKGTYGEVRILSPDSIAEMTRNQVPGLCSHWGNEFFEEAGWGYCWDIPFGKNTLGNRKSPKAFSHGGSGGVRILADPQYDLFWATFMVDYNPEETRRFEANLSDLLIESIES